MHVFHALYGRAGPGGLRWRVMHDVERAIGRVAGRQDNVIAREQLIAAGLGRGAIAYRLRVRRLRRMYQRVYLIGPRSSHESPSHSQPEPPRTPDGKPDRRGPGDPIAWRLLGRVTLHVRHQTGEVIDEPVGLVVIQLAQEPDERCGVPPAHLGHGRFGGFR